jgi:putative CocE/NonD family hydrolase
LSAWRALARRCLALPPPLTGVVTSCEWVPMADGARLATFVARPREAARASLLLRGAGDVLSARRPLPFVATLLAEQGVAVALQECRGLRASEGVFTPFVHEAADGADAIRWLSTQPWFAAPLALAGVGYGGYAAFAALAASPLPIERLVVGWAARDPYAWLHAGGALRLDEAFSLAFGLGGAERGASTLRSLGRALYHRPVRDADRVGFRRLDWLREWLDHPTRDAFWDARIAPLPGALPHALLVGSWNHAALPAQLADHAALAAAAKRTATGGAALEIGAAQGTSRRRVARQLEESLRTALRFLLGDGARHAPVRVYDAGAARWREGADWPPARMSARTLHLRGDGSAQGSDGDGRLELQPPGAFEPPDRFVYDPADATPSGDSRTRRGDVLCYASAPLPAPLALAGALRAEVHVASDAPATDFCARVVAVAEDGSESLLGEGIARVEFVPGSGAESPRRVYVDCGSACWRLAAGSRLRLEIASASHPRFDRHPDTLEEPVRADADAGVPARQTLFHDAAHPSALVIETRSEP